MNTLSGVLLEPPAARSAGLVATLVSSLISRLVCVGKCGALVLGLDPVYSILLLNEMTHNSPTQSREARLWTCPVSRESIKVVFRFCACQLASHKYYK